MTFQPSRAGGAGVERDAASEPQRPHVTRLSREINVEMRNQHGDSLSWKEKYYVSFIADAAGGLLR